MTINISVTVDKKEYDNVKYSLSHINEVLKGNGYKSVLLEVNKKQYSILTFHIEDIPPEVLTFSESAFISIYTKGK